MKSRKEIVPLGAPLPLEFKDVKGKADMPDATYFNTLVAIGKLGLDCRYDLFHGEYLINGAVLTDNEVGQVSDPCCRALRELIRVNFLFDPGERNIVEASKRACESRSFHPVKDYLASLRFDGLTSIDTWLITYMHAEDTPFNRAVSRMTLIASVRRIMHPGTKFDYITILESPEGFNKSEALEKLYGEDNFTDQSILGMGPREVEETLRGRWGVECAEIAGMRKGDMDRIKAQLSRKVDRVRRVWDRMTSNAARTPVLWASCNEFEYLRALSGENRRFLPVRVGRIDLAGLIRDRDQLWAEAVEREAIMLPEELWPDAHKVRESRTQSDPWCDALADVGSRAARLADQHDEDGVLSDDGRSYGVAATEPGDEEEERVASRFLFDCLEIPTERRSADVSKRLGLVMRELGWQGPHNLRIAGEQTKGYSRRVAQAWD